MTTVALIRNAFETEIFNGTTVTEPFINRELAQNLSEAEQQQFYDDAKINFIQCITKGFDQYGVTFGKTQKFIVTVRVYKEIIDNEDSFNEVIDRLEAIRALVLSELGLAWSNLIDWYQPSASPAEVLEIPLFGRRVWRGSEVYTAEKVTTI